MGIHFGGFLKEVEKGLVGEKRRVWCRGGVNRTRRDCIKQQQQQ